MPVLPSHLDHRSIDPFIISLSVLSCIHLKLRSMVHFLLISLLGTSQTPYLNFLLLYLSGEVFTKVPTLCTLTGLWKYHITYRNNACQFFHLRRKFHQIFVPLVNARKLVNESLHMAQVLCKLLLCASAQDDRVCT